MVAVGASGSNVGLFELGQAEIQQLYSAGFGHHDVARLDVPMDDPGGMRGRERRCDLRSVIENRRELCPRALNQLLQRDSPHVLHRNIVDARNRFDFINRNDVGMIQGGCGLGFSGETRAAARVGRIFGLQYFERGQTIQLEVAGAVNHAHASFAQFFQDLEVRNGPPNHVDAPGRGRGEWPRQPLRVDDYLRIVQLCPARSAALVVIRFAARIAGLVADRIYGARTAPAADKLLSLRAGTVAGEFDVPGFVGARVAGPGDLVALPGVVLLMLGQDLSCVVDMELMRVLGERRNRHREQPHPESDSGEESFSHRRVLAQYSPAVGTRL